MSMPTHCTLSPQPLSLSYHNESQRLLLSLSLSPSLLRQNSEHCRPLCLSMELDWDLHAVVRGCSTTSTTTTTSSSMSSSSSGFGTCGGFSYIFDSEQQQQQQQQSHVFPVSSWSSSIEELHELCKPFFTKSQPQQQLQVQSFQASSPLSSFSYTSSASPQPKLSQAQEKQQQRNKHPHPGGSVTTPRSKRRKNQLKRVCQVPVENLSSDIWAWRKYGQKPIKGSPYPRGYYRCSSSKGCLARKQVERNRSDPTMFIVTYTAEHNHPAPTHRNSLAGSTRQKPLTPQGTATAVGESEKSLTTKPSSSPSTPCGEEEEDDLSKGEKSSESMEEEKDDEGDDEFGLSDMVLPDDFFECLDELGQLTGPDAITNGDCFSDPFSAIAAMPSWVANSAAAAAAGGR